MNLQSLEGLGLNHNEARVYSALIGKGKSGASGLVKVLGIHRNIVYDNLEKLINKGFVSFIIDGSKRIFIAEDPENIVSFLEEKREKVDCQINSAKSIIPEIKKRIGAALIPQEASIFRGVSGIKKVLSRVLESKEYWDLGVTNSSVSLFGKTFWENFNTKVSHRKIKEHLLFNSDFKNDVNIKKTNLRKFRRLPSEMNQVTEIMLFDSYIALVVYSETPIVVLVQDAHLYETFLNQFNLFWNLSK
jgi:sugar-specific transcriptional regulator TrmB